MLDKVVVEMYRLLYASCLQVVLGVLRCDFTYQLSHWKHPRRIKIETMLSQELSQAAGISPPRLCWLRPLYFR